MCVSRRGKRRPPQCRPLLHAEVITPKNIWFAWSSGKDCAFALLELKNCPDVQVTGLFTTISEPYDRVSMHSTRLALVKEQAAQLGLPLEIVAIPSTCSNEEYGRKMTELLAKAKAAGVTHMAFGDLFLPDVRKYRESMLAGTGIEPLFPLWLRPTGSLAPEIIRSGIKAVITSVDPSKLPGSFVGRRFDEALLKELPPGVDPCGENGEFHTFVYEHPLFEASLRIQVGDSVERDGFFFADVTPAGT